MSLISQTDFLEYTDRVSSTNMFIHTMNGTCKIGMVPQCRADNYDYKYIHAGLNTISPNQVCQVDGNIVISGAWNANCYNFYRLNEGPLIEVLYTDTTSTNYANVTCLAVDKVRDKAYFGCYAGAGIAVINYSDPDNIVEESLITEASAGIPDDSPGGAYYNGLAYMHDKLLVGSGVTYTSGAWFVDVVTSGGEQIFSVNNITTGRNNYTWIDEDNDRLFNGYYYNGRVHVYSDFAPLVSGYCINSAYIGAGDDQYSRGFITDKDDLNWMWLTNNHYIAYVGISGCLDGSSNIPDESFGLEVRSYGYPDNLDYKIYKESIDFKSDLIWVEPYYGRSTRRGMLDQETPEIFTMYDGISNYSSDKDPIQTSYSSNWNFVTTPSGQEYVMHTGYGYDGGSITLWNHDNFKDGLEPYGEIIFGTYQMDDQANIELASIDTLINYLVIPSGCQADVNLSNDSGATWETAPAEGWHEFDSIGNSLRVQFIFSGLEYRMPYITAFAQNPAISYGYGDVPGYKKQTKTLSFKLKGA